MEGGASLKKMAKSKTASSQRSKAKHSRHARGAASTVTRGKGVAEESLPFNWERYGDESGSDEDAAPLAEGEGRPKSKGADYSELLFSEVPKLSEEPPEQGGMTAMLLANGLGLWDSDSSYLQPASSTSERQAAREAAVLLTVDMRFLGKSIGRLNVAQRLFVEDELFPKQDLLEDRVGMIDTTKRTSDAEGGATAIRDGVVPVHDDSSWGSWVSSGNVPVNAESALLALASSTKIFSKPGLDDTGDNSVIDTFPTVKSTGEHTIDVKEEMAMQGSREHVQTKKFEATAAEAELDDLLDMLDNHAAGISLNKGNEVDPTRSSPSSTFFSAPHPTTSRPSNPRFQQSGVESKPKARTLKSELGTAPNYRQSSSASAKKVEESIPHNHAKDVIAVPQDDDFDSWLDSI